VDHKIQIALSAERFLGQAVQQFGSSTIAVSIECQEGILKGNIVYVKEGL